MQKVVSKIVSFLLLAALLVSPVAAAAPERVYPPTDEVGISADEALWLEHARAADSFTVQLAEPSLATYEGSNALFAMPARTDSGKLNFEAPETVAYLDYINSKLDAFIAEAEALLGRELEVLYRYDVLLNGFSAKMSVEEAAMLRQLPEVKEVYVDEIYQIDTDVSPAYIGVDKIWDGSAVPLAAGKMGEGTIVGIIDTGINMTHPSFLDTTPLDPYVYPVTAPKGLCVTHPDTHPCNNKLIGAYDMVGDNNGNDTLDHGSHTAGTTAGNLIEVNYEGAVVTISGMAPRAQVLSYKVCDATGCATSASTAAVNQAVKDGADSLNFSIGPRSGPTRSPWMDSTEVAFLEAFKVGVSTATSSGNSGPGESTVFKTPPWAIVTGNMNHGRIFGYPVTVNPGAGELKSLALPAGDGWTVPLTADLNGKTLVWGGPDNKDGCAPWAAGSLTGKIGFVQRGTCSFKDKAENIQNAGGIFALVYNNAPGAPIVMGSETGNVTIEAAMISLEDGLLIEAAAGSPMTVNISKTLGSATKPSWGEKMADSSSRGPVTNFEILQPDLVAPGTNVLAAYADPGKVDLMSGTSMAGPHSAGATALMRSLYPDWSPAAIRSAIIMTAFPDNMKDHDGSDVNAHIIGNGRIEMSKAALAGLVMEETYAGYMAADPANGGDPRNLNIPSYQNSKCLDGCSFTRTVTNVTDVTADYAINIVKSSDFLEITTDPENGFTIAPGATQEIKVTLFVPFEALGAWQFARITFETDAEFANGKKVSDTAFTLAAQAKVEGSTMPDHLIRTIDKAQGTYTFEGVYNATKIENFTTVRYGLTAGTIEEFEVTEDPTNDNPYDDVTQNHVIMTSCPSNSQRMVVQVLESTSKDLDVYVGIGQTPHKGLEKAVSGEYGPYEYMNIIEPGFSGTCWIMVQNWEASEEGGTDPVKLAYGFVPKSGGQNYTITAPTVVEKLTPFDVKVDWNLAASFDDAEVWFGWFSLGTKAPTAKDDIAEVSFNLFKGEVDPELDQIIYLPLIFIEGPEQP